MAKTTGVEPITPSTPEPLPVEPKAEPVTPEPNPTEPAKDAAWWESKAKAMEKEKEVAAKKLAKFEDAEKQRMEAEKSELQKAQDRAEAAELKAAEAERKATRQKVAAELGLPAILAERLAGNDEEAMREDAAKLLEALPKAEPAKKPAGPAINPTNPSAANIAETLAQKKERLHMNSGVQIWDDTTAQRMGGGILTND